MALPAGFPPRRLPGSLRSRLEIATALASEALVETHVKQATRFVRLFEQWLPLEDALDRYQLEMDFSGSIASSVRTRALVKVGDHPDPAEQRGRRTRRRRNAARPAPGARGREPNAAAAKSATGADGVRTSSPEQHTDDGGWGRLRPDRMVRGAIERQRRSDELDSWVYLAVARAEEAVIATHVENAIRFAALLDGHLPLDRAVQQYLDAVDLGGGRAQTVHQRAMARLADIHLPDPPRRPH